MQSVGSCGIWHQVEWGSTTEKMLLENQAFKVEKPMRAEADQVVWHSRVNKGQNHTNGQQNKDDYKGRQHRRKQKVWKKTHTKHCPDFRWSWRKKETNKFAKEDKLFARIPDGYISWDTNWNKNVILTTCEMGIGTAVITMAEVILKDMPVSLH